VIDIDVSLTVDSRLSAVTITSSICRRSPEAAMAKDPEIRTDASNVTVSAPPTNFLTIIDFPFAQSVLDIVMGAARLQLKPG